MSRDEYAVCAQPEVEELHNLVLVVYRHAIRCLAESALRRSFPLLRVVYLRLTYSVANSDWIEVSRLIHDT